MIYFIRDEASGMIKIGFAADPWLRLSKIQSDTPSRVCIGALEEGGKGREAELHAQFADHRARGEWFNPHPSLMAYMEELGEPEAPLRMAPSRGFWGGMYDAEIARALRISKSTLCTIRSGKRKPSPELAIRLQRLTGKSAIELVFGELASEAA